tara:strand:- start:1100 stop:1375 length:276 start_codon:yes stop_codon:yes gene_type:complete
MTHNGNYQQFEKIRQKSLATDPLDLEAVDREIPVFFVCMWLQDYQKAYELIEQIQEEPSSARAYEGFREVFGISAVLEIGTIAHERQQIED